MKVGTKVTFEVFAYMKNPIIAKAEVLYDTKIKKVETHALRAKQKGICQYTFNARVLRSCPLLH